MQLYFTSFSSTPVCSISLHSAPHYSTPHHSTPIHSNPIKSAPIQSNLPHFTSLCSSSLHFTPFYRPHLIPIHLTVPHSTPYPTNSIWSDPCSSNASSRFFTLVHSNSFESLLDLTQMHFIPILSNPVQSNLNHSTSLPFTSLHLNHSTIVH